MPRRPVRCQACIAVPPPMTDNIHHLLVGASDERCEDASYASSEAYFARYSSFYFALGGKVGRMASLSHLAIWLFVVLAPIQDIVRSPSSGSRAAYLDAREEDETAAHYHLQAGEQEVHPEVVVSDVGDHQELQAHHDVGDRESSMHLGDQEG